MSFVYIRPNLNIKAYVYKNNTDFHRRYFKILTLDIIKGWKLIFIGYLCKAMLVRYFHEKYCVFKYETILIYSSFVLILFTVILLKEIFTIQFNIF